MKQQYAIRCIILILLTALFGCGGPSGSSLLPSDNQGGNNNPPPSLFPPATPPPIPVITTANTLADRVELDWSDTSTREDGFTIERDGIQIATTPRNISAWADTNVQPGTTYCYAIRSYNVVGKSNASPLECATIPLPPSPPEPARWILPQGAQIRSFATNQATGELYAAGITYESLPGFTNAGGSDMFLVKLNPDGTLAWFQQWGTVGYDFDWDMTVFEGNIFLLWNQNGAYGIGDGDEIVSKFDAQGNEIATFVLGDYPFYSIAIDNSGIYAGSMRLDHAGVVLGWLTLPWFGWTLSDIAVRDGIIYITGDRVVTISSAQEVYTAKFDTDGNVLSTTGWTISTIGAESGRSIAVNPAGMFIGGWWGFDSLTPPDHGGGSNPPRCLVLRYDAQGNFLWAHQDTRVGYFSRVISDNDAAYMIGGSSGTCGLTKITNDGAVAWQTSVVGRSLALSNNVLFVADGTNVIHRYDTLTGNQIP